MTAPSRDSLVYLCERGVVPHEHWRDRDSASAQRQLGECLALLRAGCDFTVRREGDTWWVTVTFDGFGHFDWDGPQDEELFYVPTAERLDRRAGRDWY